MMYHKIECPTCGNEVVAMSISNPQKCPWCKRLFVTNLRKRKGKVIWSAKPVGFEEMNGRGTNRKRHNASGLERDR